MADLLPGEGPELSVSCRLASCGRFKQSVEAAESARADIRPPLSTLFVVGDPLNARRVIDTFLAISQILGVSCKAQVLDPVIRSNPVDVVDVKALGDSPMHIDPCQPVRVLARAEDAHNHIVCGLVSASALSANHVSTPKSYGLDAHKTARFWRVLKELFDLFLRGFGVGDIHTKSC